MCTVTERLWGAKVGANVRSRRAIVGDIRRRQAIVAPAWMTHTGQTTYSKNSRRDGGIRTRALLLPNQPSGIAGDSPTSPNVPSTW